MEIEIEQGEFKLFGDEYQIRINGKHTHNAIVKYFLYLIFFNGIDLVEVDNDRTLLQIKKDSMEIPWNYWIIQNSQEYFFTREDFRGFEYSCKSNKDTYRLYSHNDRKRSILKNEVQVAWWDKDTFSFGGGDYYKIIADNDCNYPLLIAICVIIDHIHSRHSKSGFSFDAGNPFTDLPEFDKNWKPKP
jgi:uncharacterized protein YxjI